jgi:hypothetical protein
MKKNKFGYLIILVPLLGMKLSRFLVSVYGEEVRIIMISICLLMLIATIIVLALKKKSYEAIMSTCILIPLLISGVGMYLDNLLLEGVGLAAIFVVIIIFVVIKKYREK